MGSLRTRDCIRVEKDQRKVLNLIERAFQWKLGAAGRVASARMEWAAARVDDFDDMLLAWPGYTGTGCGCGAQYGKLSLYVIIVYYIGASLGSDR